MTRIGRAADLIGRPVITLDGAVAVGEIKDVLVDPQRSVVVYFTLRARGLLASPLVGILTSERVRSIGRDAVMIGSAADVLAHREGLGTMVGEQQEVIGREVVTQHGASLGSVGDVLLELDGRWATVVGYEIVREDGQRALIPVAGGVSISADALVVPADVEAHAANGLAGFRQALMRLRHESMELGA
jgi:uncharacterized protein YrrD